ncbi:MAG: hypothetical protein F4X59_17515 [Holophagales bacterium]|nr:hypothetical protein [Holophagales bacterium]MYC11905.1 hypothetical protein [Holophagales bacterium]
MEQPRTLEERLSIIEAQLGLTTESERLLDGDDDRPRIRITITEWSSRAVPGREGIFADGFMGWGPSDLPAQFTMGDDHLYYNFSQQRLWAHGVRMHEALWTVNGVDVEFMPDDVDGVPRGEPGWWFSPVTADAAASMIEASLEAFARQHRAALQHIGF